MNFKKYHVSRNKFDKDNTTIYSAYFDQGGSWMLSADSKSVKMPCQPNTQYTLSVPNSLAVFRVYESNNASIEPKYPSTADIPRATEIIRGTNISQYTFTTSSTAQIILFQGSNGAVTEWFNGLMLNTGPEALPFEPHGNTWHDTPNYIHKTATDTITTLPAVLYPNAVTATVGLQGNMQQTGTPTPQNPIQPSECGDMSSNMFDINSFMQGVVPERCTVNYNSATNTITINSTGNDAHTGNNNSYHIPVIGGETYTLSWDTNSAGGAVYIFENGLTDSAHLHYWSSSLKIATLTARSDTTYFIVRVGASSANTTKTYTNIMLNVGSTAKPFEPYGIKIPISSANTTTPVYLGEVESTRQITKYEFTGQEDWLISNTNNVAYVDRSGHLTGDINICYCSHYKSIVNVSSLNDIANGECCFNSTLRWFYIKDDNYTTQSAFLNYLQQQYANGTPVTIWYVLATPTTGIVNEPLRKIGDFADTVSGITIPTIAGTNSFDVLTTLKPSEVTATYKGWHPVSSVHERDNGAWTE